MTRFPIRYRFGKGLALRLAGAPVRLRELLVSVADPDALIAALSP